MMFLQSIAMSSGRGVIPHRRSREQGSTSPRAEVSSVEPVKFRYRRYSPDERRQSQSRPTILFIKGDGGFFFFALI